MGNSDQYGKFISSHLGLSVFKRSREQWKANFDKKQKTKELFKEFLNKKPDDDEDTTTKTKKLPSNEFSDFMIDKSGDQTLLKRNREQPDEQIETKVAKKKKKVAKSYLDDL